MQTTMGETLTGEAISIYNPSSRVWKRSTCATGGVREEDYNTPLHVGALFIVLFVSTTACAFPMLALRFPKIRIPAGFLFAARHFGTGVLVATAFCHLLPTAFILLTDPCLPHFWNDTYPAMPGAIALAGIFFVAIIEMIFSPAQHVCGGGARTTAMITRAPHCEKTGCTRDGNRAGESNVDEICPARSSPTSPVIEPMTTLRDHGPLHGRVTSISRTVSRMGEQNRRLEAAEGQKIKKTLSQTSHESTESPELTSEQIFKRDVLQCALLEMGILFHSVFIGMSLSVSTGSEFVILLTAISFHRESQFR